MTALRAVPPLIVLGIFALDRFTKHLVETRLQFGDIKPVTPFFNLTYVTNTGAAFGVGENQNTFFIGISILILILLFVIARKSGAGFKVKTAFALIVGGALGNLYDRITRGSVTDFLDFYAGAHHWPAFNVADSSILVGAALVAVLQWRETPAGVKEESIK
jgi:signal peptidase II